MPDATRTQRRFATIALAAMFGLGLVALWQANQVTAGGGLAIALGALAGGAVLRARVSWERAELARRAATAERARDARGDELAAEAAVAAAALEALPDPIVQIDADRLIVGANAAARAALGVAVGRDLTAALRDPNVLAAVDAALEGGAPPPVALSLPGGVAREFEARVAPVRAGSASRARLVLTLHDVTAARRADAMRADFVANVSHELRTPLTSVLGFTETLRGPAKDDPEARDRFLGIMHAEALRMTRLVQDLLSLSRIEAAEHTPPTDSVAIAPLLGAVIDALAPVARDKGIAIDVELPPGLPAVIGDADQLAQVFQNLVDNAIKYGRPQSRVRVAAQRTTRPGQPGGFVAVAIADQGEGISREHLPRLTERFYRVDAGRSRRLGGTGLGLAIVKHIVNRHRGALSVDSEPGRGSVFTVHLPAESG